MTPDRKTPGVAFWATVVVVVVLVVYPLSFGPACWLATRGASDSHGRTAVLYGYYPILWFANAVPEPVGQAVLSYAGWMASDGSSPGLLTDGTPTWFYSIPSRILIR